MINIASFKRQFVNELSDCSFDDKCNNRGKGPQGPYIRL